MNITLFYIQAEESDVDKIITPSLKGIHVHRYPVVDISDIKRIPSSQNGIMVCYLPSDELREVLTWAAEKEIQIVILPYPKDDTIAKSLGLTGSIEEILENIKTRDEPIPVEVLYCNGSPVFESVKIGTFFTKDDNTVRAPWLKRWQKFFRAVFNYSHVIHQPFIIKSGDEKIIDTSAIGLLAVEHAETSVLSLQWVIEEEPGDGQFHFFIVSPQNVFELIRYIFTSVIKKPGKKAARPDFIGYIKSHTLEITGIGTIKYFQDGKEREDENLKLDIKRNNLQLFQETKFVQKDLSEEPKKSLRLKGLPIGDTKNAIIGKNIPWLPRATSDDFKELFTQLRENASASTDYLVMLILSTVIATFGLYGNSSPVIIGAMILAPLMAPIVAFSMGVVRYDVLLLKKGIKTIFFGTIVALGVSIVISQMIPLKIMTIEMQARLSPTLLDLGIAVASGVAAAYAHAKEGIAQSLAGVAIAVALIPPLAVSGIGIGWMDWHIFSGAFLLYLTNLAGIILFGGFTFWILGFTPFKRAGKGLLYTLFIVLLLCVPLSFSFNHIAEEARITQVLEGYELDNYVFREVEVRYGDPMTVEFKLVSPQAISNEEMERVKNEIQNIVGKRVTVRIISSIEF